MREDIEGGNCSSWPTMAAGGFSGARVSHSFAQEGRLPDVAREVELGSQKGHLLAVAQKI